MKTFVAPKAECRALVAALAILCAAPLALDFPRVDAIAFTDDFDTDPAPRFTTLSGNVPVFDAANGEWDIAINSSRWGFRYNTPPGSLNHEAQATWQVGTIPANDGVGGPSVRVRSD